IDPQKVKEAITNKTKAVISVDFGGWPCDFEQLHAILSSDDVIAKFQPRGTNQEKFGRPVLISDAAHSLGAKYKNRPAATASDITIFSLHAVKNITTAEGGVICLNLPPQFDVEEEYRIIKLNTNNGQTKDAFTKVKSGTWRYDIVSKGFKFKMSDIC